MPHATNPPEEKTCPACHAKMKFLRKGKPIIDEYGENGLLWNTTSANDAEKSGRITLNITHGIQQKMKRKGKAQVQAVRVRK
jgi:hypothetical protein